MLEHSSYTIQRLTKPFTGEIKHPLQALAAYGLSATGLSKGAMEIIRSICVFDYMGSAEFEFGAIPKALIKIANAPDLVTLEGVLEYRFKSYSMPKEIYGRRAVHIICANDDREEVLKRIKAMAIGEEHCQERTQFSGSCADYEYDKDVVGWFDLDNAFMWFVDESMYKGFAKLFGILK